jgi:hypothetical protein
MEARRSRRQTRRVAAMPPKRGHDALTLLVEFPQPELFALAVHHVDDPRSLLALELVNKALRDIMRSPALNGAWAAEMPRQIDQRLGQAVNCIGKPNVNESMPSTLAARGRYLRSRHATLRLRDVIDAKSRYGIETDRFGRDAVDTVERHHMAHPSLQHWWADAKDAILQGADVDLRDYNGQTLLHWAVKLGDFKMVRELCKAGLSALDGDVVAERPIDLALPDSRIADMLSEYFGRDQRLILEQQRWPR